MSVMRYQLGSGERLTLDNLDGEDIDSLSTSQGSSDGLIISDSGATLDLTPAADNVTNVTVTINVDGSITVTIAGLASDNDTHLNVANIIGNANGGLLTIVGPDVDTNWTLDGSISGSLTFTNSGDTTTTINFSDVDTINGGTGNDTLVVATTTPNITFDAGSGNADTIVNKQDKCGCR